MAWLSGWAADQRIRFDIDSSKIDAALSDYKVAIRISASSGIGGDDLTAVFTELGSDANRKKIAVTASNGTTEFKVEIEKWDHANSTAMIWVIVSSVSDLVDETIFFYYDSTHADNTANVGDTGEAAAQAVWGGNSAGVWHLAQDPTGGELSILDSSPNTNDGTPSGFVAGDLIDGPVGGKALTFDGSNNVVTITDHASLDITTNTLEALVRIDAVGAVGMMLDKGLNNNTREAYGLLHAWNNPQFEYRGADTIFHQFRASTNALVNGTWYHIASKHSNTVGSSTELFINGASQTASYLVGDGNSAMVIDGGPVTLGRSRTSLDYAYLNGVLAEVRITNIALSDAWIKANYYNLFDTLIAVTADTPEAGSGLLLAGDSIHPAIFGGLIVR